MFKSMVPVADPAFPKAAPDHRMLYVVASSWVAVAAAARRKAVFRDFMLVGLVSNGREGAILLVNWDNFWHIYI